MRLTTFACRGAVRQILPQSGQPIWITDDILANAFQGFLRVSNSNRKRHGSNVPGPLEARRRLAKRHMMGLATAGATGPDMGAIFGLGPPRQQDLKWEAPYTVEQPLEREPAHAPPLPLWLSDFQSLPVDSPAPADADRLTSYKARLADSTSLEDLRSVVTGLAEDERRAPTYSRLAFEALRRKMRRKTMPFNALVEFLKDPLLNHPEAENTSAVLIAITHTEYSNRNRKDEYTMLVETIKQSLTLGTLMESEVQSILNNLPSVVRKVWNKPKHQDHALCDAYRAVWEGMTACRIVQYNAVDGPLLRKLIANLLQLHPTSKSKALLSEVYQFAWPISDGRRTTSVVGEMAFWIRRLAVEDAGKDLSSEWSSTRRCLKNILEVLPQKGAQGWINVVTAQLARAATAEENANPALSMWLAFLRGSPLLEFDSQTDRPSWNGVYTVLAAVGQPALIADHFKTMTGCDTGRILLKYWIPRYVPKETESTGGRETSLAAVVERFKTYLSQRPTEHARMRQSFLCLILALHDYGQPYRIAMRHLLDLLCAMHGPRALLIPVRKFRRRNMQVDYKPLAAAIQKLCGEESQPALRLALRLYRCSKVWLCTCPKLPLALIKANHHRLSIFKMLARHDPTNTLPMRLRTVAINPLNQVRNNLVHHIAYAFAQHEQRSTRVAFRDVYLCYRYLRSRGAPLQPLLSKAFVKAGVIRPLQNMEWVSTVKFRFILKLVRELEGDDVAEELDRVVWQWRCRMVWEKRDAANPRMS